MSEETVEVFRAMREHSQQKRRANLHSSTEILRQRGIAFESHNSGLHLVIRRGERTWDFWPSSGKYRERDRSAVPGSFAVHRKSVSSGRGVFNLLKAIGAS